MRRVASLEAVLCPCAEPLPLAYASNEATMALATLGFDKNIFLSWKNIWKQCANGDQGRGTATASVERLFSVAMSTRGESDRSACTIERMTEMLIKIANKAPEEHEDIIRGHSDFSAMAGKCVTATGPGTETMQFLL